MSKISRNLLEGEAIGYVTQIHWCTLLAPGFLFLILLPGAAVAAAHRYFSLSVAAGAAGLWLLACVWQRRNSEFAVTNIRVVIHTGSFATDSMDVMLPKICGVEVHQGFWGRIFGFGSLILEGTGGARERFEAVADPFELRREIEQRVSRAALPPGFQVALPPTSEVSHESHEC
jgi:uncharacterized membrane protein YdbT with pleckstrin-like domain